MLIRTALVSATLALASLAMAHAADVRPVEARSIDLGDVSGVAYYTVERDGFRVVMTLAQGDAGTPVRMTAILAPGQRVILSTPRDAGAVEISRQADTLQVRKAAMTD